MSNSKILVWDIPTRLFHWLLAISFAVAYVTAEEEGLQSIHITAGYTLAGLLVFRLLWGFIGSRYARFSEFLYSPAQIVSYIKNLHTAPRHYLGHNPLGSVAVFLLLGLGALTAATGYFLYESGAEWLEETHELAANGMLALVCLHIAGVFFSSRIHGENLARAMVTGMKSGTATDSISSKHLLIGGVILLAVAGFWGYSWTHPFAAKDDEAGEMHGDGEHEDHAQQEHDEQDRDD